MYVDLSRPSSAALVAEYLIPSVLQFDQTLLSRRSGIDVVCGGSPKPCSADQAADDLTNENGHLTPAMEGNATPIEGTRWPPLMGRFDPQRGTLTTPAGQFDPPAGQFDP